MTENVPEHSLDPEALAAQVLAALPEAQSGLERDVRRVIYPEHGPASDSILQLGIEAARVGDKEEARSLFRLFTRQEPENAQGWLWLAGVAEGRDERQHALERVLASEPDNELARKGLQAMGLSLSTPRPMPAAPGPAVGPDPFDDDPFAELDNLSDALSADTSGPVRRAETDDGAYATTAAAARGAVSARSASVYDDDDEYEAPRRGFSPLMVIVLILGLIAVLALGWLRGLRPAGLVVVGFCWILIYGAGAMALAMWQSQPIQPARRTTPRPGAGARGSQPGRAADEATSSPVPARANPPGARITRKLAGLESADSVRLAAPAMPDTLAQPGALDTVAAGAPAGAMAPMQTAAPPPGAPPGLVPAAGLAGEQAIANAIRAATDIKGLSKAVFRIEKDAEGQQSVPYREVQLILKEVEQRPGLKQNLCTILASFTGDTGKLVFPITAALVSGLIAGQAVLMLTPLGIATFTVIMASAGVKVICGDKGADE